MSGLGTNARIAIASAVSLGAQALLGVVMLRMFLPQDVGRFTTLSQIGFFWMTLALAQSPLHLLANIHLTAANVLREALRAGLARWLMLSPLAAAAICFADLSAPVVCLAWTALLALLQMGWYMAQAWTLRTASAGIAAAIRAAPPLLAVAAAAVSVALWPEVGAGGLLVAAAAGYGLGSLGLLHDGRKATQPAHASPPVPRTKQADDRSTALRLAHTVADATVGTAVLLVWQRLYGSAEASYMAVLLRVLGMIPAVVHSAWPQVLLTQGRQRRVASIWVGLSGAACTALVGSAACVALQLQWLSPAWQGLQAYVLPLVLWQGAACMFAAHAHLPFQRGHARRYSWASIGFETLQLLVLVLPFATGSGDRQLHLWALAGSSTVLLLMLTLWMADKKYNSRFSV